MRNRCMFEKMAAGMALAAAVMAGAAMLPGSGHGLVINAYAADVSNQNSQNISGGTRSKDGIDKTDEADGKEGDAEAGAESGKDGDTDEGIYDFKDNKTIGTITITKKWDDGLTNAEREIPDMYLSTEKPSKSTKGYTVTFHGNGLKFADGTDENMVVYNSSGQIVEGSYKEAVGTGVGWYADKGLTQRVEISDDGVPQVELTGDLDLWAKEMTFEIDGFGFVDKIPKTTTEIIFTDETKPKTKKIIDVDADGDGGVVAWLDDDAGTVMKVSTQILGMKVQTSKYCRSMFYHNSMLQKIDFKMLDTSSATDISSMFDGCSGLTSLDLSPLDTQNVTDMSSMFSNCSGLTSLDLTPLDTQNVTDMGSMLSGCSGLTSLDLTPLNTQNVTDMGGMFRYCSGLTSLDLAPLDTQKVTDMSQMFSGCSGLTSLDLAPLDTQNVTNMWGIFSGCSGLTSLDVSPLDTQNVTSMSGMFSGCRGLTNLDLSSFDTNNVTRVGGYGQYGQNGGYSYGGATGMFENCSSLVSLIIPFDTSHITDFGRMFQGCSSLTTLDISTFDTTTAKDMGCMFDGCKNLTNINLPKTSTKNVTSLNGMFNNCNSLKSLDLSSFDTSNVTDMVYMFNNCSSLTSLTTGTNFKFVGTNYYLPGTWQNTAGETFTSGKFPSNVADTYTKVSS